jgi:pantothenate kinase
VTAIIDQDEALRRARALAGQGKRTVLGIAGPPAAGKSTLAGWLARQLGEVCAVVPMDGFHLADVELTRIGLRDRKGVPASFDGYGYLALLRRIVAQPVSGEPIVYAPAFARDLEQPLAGALPIPLGVPLIITEGNYLLVDQAPWRDVRTLLTEVWYCDLADTLRRERLFARHREFGKEWAVAESWMTAVDDPNAELIAGTKGRADALVRMA